MNLRAILTSGLVCFFAGALYGWSALIGPLQDRFGVSTGRTGLVFSLAIVSFTCAVILIPWVMRHAATPRTVACLGLLGAVCVFAAARVGGLAPFLALFSGGFGFASGGVYIAALGVAGRSPRHRVATPAMVASFGLGGAIFGPLWRQMDARGWGLDGLDVLAVGLLVTSVAALFVQQAETAAPKDIGRPETQQGDTPIPVTQLWLVFAFGSFGGLMVLGLAAKMLDAGEVGLGMASLTLAGVAVGNTLGRLSVAVLVRQLPLRGCLMLAMGLTLLGLCAAIWQTSAALLCAGLVLVAAGYGIVAAAVPVLTRAAFGAVLFQRRFALVFSAWGVAGFMAPWAGGALFDLRGSFAMPLVLAGLSSVICLVLVRRMAKFV